jgi:atypical dual specificity phosphatase
MAAILRVNNLDVGFDNRVVLSGVDFTIEPKSVFVLMGPGGAGKSTLVRTVTGSVNSETADVSGEVAYRGSGESPSFLCQNPSATLATVYEYLASAHPGRSEFTRAKFREQLAAYLEERGLEGLVEHFDREVVELSGETLATLRVVRAALERGELVCLDEPASSLEADEAAPIEEFVRRESDERAFLFVTHNQRRAREIGDHVALLAGGRIIEHGSVDEFFDSPETEATKQYLRTGSCSVTAPEVAIRPNGESASGTVSRRDSEPSEESISESTDDAEDSGREGESRITYRHPSEVRGPQSFRWLIGGRLGGSPIPGAACPVEHDLRALERIGVTLLVTLTTHSLPDEALAEVGFENIHFPIPDTEAPELEAAGEICAEVAHWLTNGAAVVFHCRAGMGRAGTMLCSMLIWAGHSADCALQWARRIYEKWVQTDEQEAFLESFEAWLAEHQPERQERIFSGDLAPHHCRCK